MRLPGILFISLFALSWVLPDDTGSLELQKAVLALISLGCGVWWLYSWFTRPPGIRAGPDDAAKLAKLQSEYPFLNAAAKVFAGPLEVFIHKPHGNGIITLRKLSPQNGADFERALILLQRSATFEAHKRGYQIRSDTNELLLRPRCDDGFVVETKDNDDGSLDAIVAYDIDRPVTADDYTVAAQTVRVAGILPGWKGTMWKPREEREFFDGMMPLYQPRLKTVRVTHASANDNPFRPQSTEKGAAQWAWVDEMQSSPMVGYLPGKDVDWDERYDAPGAVLGGFFKSHWGDYELSDYAEIFARGEGHRIVVGPSGSGKFTAVFAPLLLMTDNASAVVFDIKNGEAARITAPWRATLGPVLVIDPFGVSGHESGSLNPLDFLTADDPDLLQAAKRLTDALFIVPPGGANEEYFNDQARDVLTAYLLHVATDIKETDRTLRRVRELIRRPLADSVLAAMADNPIAGGVVSDVAANLIEAMKADAERNTFYVMQTLRANTAFLDLPAVQRATETTSFDPRELRERVSTLYVCLPQAELKGVGRWLRLVYSSILEQVSARAPVPLHILIDEFPALGKFSRVSDDMALVRDYGIHIHIVTQSLARLEAIYGPEWQSFMTNARYQQLLGANDQMTAEYFSAGLGKTTRRSTSSSQSRSTGGGSQSQSAGWEAADLMSPDELRRMHPDETIVIVEGMNPLRLVKHHYFEGGLLDARLPAAPVK